MKKYTPKRPGRGNGPSIEELQEYIQRLEQRLTADGDKQRAPTLFVPQADGSLATPAQHRSNRDYQHAAYEVASELAWLEERLAKGEWLTVTNPLDKTYDGYVNGVHYTVPARETKELPEPLARHFLRKMSYIDRNNKFERDMGAVETGQQMTQRPQTLEQLAGAVRYFDKYDIDPVARRRIF